MILALRISSILALALGCILLVVAGVCWWNDSPEAVTQGIPDIAYGLSGNGKTSPRSYTTSLLVSQAEAFAAHLNPSVKPQASPSPTTMIDSTPQPPAPAATATLKLHATSCYPDQPGKSMALISGVGVELQGQRWVKEGSQYGSFQIHEIRRGEIVYRQGDQLHEVAIDHPLDRPSIVRDIRVDSQRLSAAIRPFPTPAGPNDVEITGN